MSLIVPTLPHDVSQSWRPQIRGWAKDILPFYHAVATSPDLPDGSAIVEVGVAWGRSIIYLAEQLIAAGKSNCKIYGVDTWPEAWEERFLRGEVGGESWYVKAMQSILANAAKAELEMIRLLRVESNLASEMLWDIGPSLVFLDGSHDYDDVKSDFIDWHTSVKRGGILAGHDYDAGSHPGVKQAVDECRGNLDFRVDDTVWQVQL